MPFAYSKPLVMNKTVDNLGGVVARVITTLDDFGSSDISVGR